MKKVVLFSSFLLFVLGFFYLVFFPSFGDRNLFIVGFDVEIDGPTKIFSQYAFADENYITSSTTIISWRTKGDEYKISSQNAKYDTRAGVIELWGKVSLRGKNIFISCDRAKVFLDGGKVKSIFGEGNIYVEEGGKEAYSKSIYFENNIVSLEGEPKVIQGDLEIRAGKISFNIETGEVFFEGVSAEIKRK